MLITGVIEKDPASGVHSVDFRDNCDWELPATSGGTTPLHLYALKMYSNNFIFYEDWSIGKEFASFLRGRRL